MNLRIRCFRAKYRRDAQSRLLEAAVYAASSAAQSARPSVINAIALYRRRAAVAFISRLKRAGATLESVDLSDPLPALAAIGPLVGGHNEG